MTTTSASPADHPHGPPFASLFSGGYPSGGFPSGGFPPWLSMQTQTSQQTTAQSSTISSSTTHYSTASKAFETITLAPTLTKTVMTSATAPVEAVSRSMSPKTKAGVGVAVTIGALLVFGLLVWMVLFVRRRRRARGDVPGREIEEKAGLEPVILPGRESADGWLGLKEMDGRSLRREIEGTPRYELEQSPVELHG